MEAGSEAFDDAQSVRSAGRPDEPNILSELHGRILHAFNEDGVQIMSPNYEADAAAPKVVPKSRWFAPPAKPEPEA